MKKVIITGHKGTIGTVLQKGLKDKYQLTLMDLPEQDIRDYDLLIKTFPSHDAVIHLAWDTKTDNMSSERINPENSLMFENVYRAAHSTGVKRVIMASSVHVDSFYKERGNPLMNPYDLPHPDSPYGAHKVFMERLGEWYAKQKGLEVICIRFGGIGPQDKPSQITDSASIAQVAERAVWLSHRDCLSLIEKCLEARQIPGNFAIIYGISNNTKRIHDVANPIGWVPQDNCDL